MPLTFLVIAMTAGTGADGPVLRRFLQVGIFFMVLGPVLTVVLTLLHTLFERKLGAGRRIASVFLAAVLGSCVVLPLVLEPGRFEGVLFGAFGGAVYGFLIHLPILARRGGGTAAEELHRVG